MGRPNRTIRRFPLLKADRQVSRGVIPGTPREDLCLRFVGSTASSSKCSGRITPPPHLHAIYGEHESVISILTSEIVRGRLPTRAHGLIREWIALHYDELIELSALAERSQPLSRIDPLP